MPPRTKIAKSRKTKPRGRPAEKTPSNGEIRRVVSRLVNKGNLDHMTVKSIWEVLKSRYGNSVKPKFVKEIKKAIVGKIATAGRFGEPLPRHFVWKKQDGTVVYRYATDTQAVAWGWTRVWPGMLTNAGQLIDKNNLRYRRLPYILSRLQ